MKLWEDKVKKTKSYISKEYLNEKNILKLDENENPYPPSPEVKKVIEQFDKDTLKRYPNTDAIELKSVLARHYGIDASQIFVGNGSDEVMLLAFMSYFNSDKPVLFPDISYSLYKVWCSFFNIPYEALPLKNDMRINIKDYYKKNGGIVFPNPNTITGIGEEREFIEEIIEHNKDVIVIIDETCAGFGGYSAIDLLGKYDNIVIVNTFSKSRSLAGLRIGTALAGKHAIDILESVKNSYNPYNLNSISMVSATASVKDEKYFRETTDKIVRTRENSIKLFREIGFEICPSKSNFIFLTHPKASAKDLYEKLKDENIFVKYFNLPRIDNYIRITIGTDEEMNILIKAVKKFI